VKRDPKKTGPRWRIVASKKKPSPDRSGVDRRLPPRNCSSCSGQSLHKLPTDAGNKIAQCDLSIEKSNWQKWPIAQTPTRPQSQYNNRKIRRVPSHAREKAPKIALELSLAGHLQAYPRSRSNDNPWIEHFFAVLNLLSEIGNQHGESGATRKPSSPGLGPKPQQQDQWAASAELPHTQKSLIIRAATTLRLAGDDTGQKPTPPLGSFYRREKTRLSSVLQRQLQQPQRKLGCLIYRLIKNGQGYKEPDLHTYELKYKDQILNSLRKRAETVLDFDLVQVPKAA